MRVRRLAQVAALIGACLIGPAGAEDGADTRTSRLLDVLVAAYPDQLAGHERGELLWRDGTRMPASDGRDGKTFAQLLETASIVDMFAVPYRPGAPSAPPALNDDPGRFRNEPFFLKMYGDCRKGEVERRLTTIVWLPKTAKQTVRVTSVNGVADRLSRVSDELERLPAETRKLLHPLAGVYNCRPVAGTKQLSVHGFAAAIDISTAAGDYWRWAKARPDGRRPYRNRVPYEIVEIFERHGFIWGGKWDHFDTFHFEYRPELLRLKG